MEEKRNYPKGIFARAGKLYLTVYDPVKKRSRQISTGLSDAPKNFKSARQILERVKKEYKNTKFYSSVKPGMLTFLDYMDFALETGKIKSGKISEPLHAAKKAFINCCGDKRMDEYTSEDALRFKQSLLDEGFKWRTINAYIIHVSGIFKKAVNDEIIDRNIFTTVKFIRGLSEPVKVIPDDDLRTIFEYLQSVPKYNYMYDIIYLLYLTGFRIGEALNLKWPEISLEDKHIRLNNTKAQRIDLFPISSPLEAHLIYLKSKGIRSSENFVFPGINQMSFSNTFRRIQENHVFHTGKFYNLHKIRKTFITKIVNSGLPPLVVQKLARHTSLQTTLKYYVAIETKEMITQLNKVFS